MRTRIPSNLAYSSKKEYIRDNEVLENNTKRKVISEEVKRKYFMYGKHNFYNSERMKDFMKKSVKPTFSGVKKKHLVKIWNSLKLKKNEFIPLLEI